ncbi:MAG: hydroxyacid dehydrogenase [Candidatus Brocadiia bacterium]
MKITAFEVEDWEREAFAGLAEAHNVEVLNESLTEENADQYEDSNVVTTFIYSELDEDVLDQLSELKMIATRSTGCDHIPLDYCRDRGITVCNVPEYGTHTVAEHAFGLLLTVSHNLYEAIDRTRKGDFSPQGLRGFDLHGKTFGVVGTGNIGKAAIGIAEGFGLDVVAYDKKPDEEAARQLGFDYVELDELLEISDVISIHVPGTPATHHLISNEEFDKMKDGVVIINTARGNVVDVQALVKAIADQKVAGAGLDVLPEEPTIREEAELLRSVYQRKHNLEELLANHVLLHLRNVVVTPHSAFNTREAVREILETTVQNIKSYADGEPSNIVRS